MPCKILVRFPFHFSISYLQNRPGRRIIIPFFRKTSWANCMATGVVSYEVRRNRLLGRILIWPAAFWLVIFFALPLVIVVVFSFLTPDQATQVRLPFTPDNYFKVADPIYTGVIVRSIIYAVETTVICLLV